MRKIVLFPSSLASEEKMERLRSIAGPLFSDRSSNISSSAWWSMGAYWHWFNARMLGEVERELGQSLVARWLRPTDIKDVERYEYCTAGDELMTKPGDRLHVFPFRNRGFETVRGSVERAVECSLLPVTTKHVCIETPTEPCAVPFGSQVPGVLRVTFWGGLTMPGIRATDLPPSNLGRLVTVRGQPLAEIHGDHTVLILRNLFESPDTTYIGEVLSEIGAALRRASSDEPAAVRAQSQASVVRLDLLGKVSYHDVPAGTDVNGLVAIADGTVTLSPSVHEVYVNGRYKYASFDEPLPVGASVQVMPVW